jgi:hypothetical protein
MPFPHTARNRADSSVANLIAKVLAGSWRSPAPSLEVTQDELLLSIPLLLRSGAGGLGWRRVSASGHSTTEASQQLQQAYRLHALQALGHERDIKRVLTLLRRDGIEPILVKGWSIARLYPEPGLRPYGDIDLCVRPDDFARTKTLLRKAEGETHDVDLHRGFQTFGYESWWDLNARSALLEIDGIPVRVLSPEDHLRLICFHFLREGAWRPLWLCDIAVALETRPHDFDWELCLGRGLKRRHWFTCAILLAHYLVEASLECVPALITSKQPPRWLIPAMLREWNAPTMPLRHVMPMSRALQVPRNTLKGLRARWPSPIEATIGVRGSFNEMPRLPFQLGHCLGRAAKYFLASA